MFEIVTGLVVSSVKAAPAGMRIEKNERTKIEGLLIGVAQTFCW